MAEGKRHATHLTKCFISSEAELISVSGRFVTLKRGKLVLLLWARFGRVICCGSIVFKNMIRKLWFTNLTASRQITDDQDFSRKLKGDLSPTIFEVSGSNINVTFVSDSSVRKQGFRGYFVLSLYKFLTLSELFWHSIT